MSITASGARVPTWETVGVPIKGNRIEDMLESVGLNFDLKKVPISIDVGEGVTLKHDALLRKDNKSAKSSFVSFVPKEHKVYAPRQMMAFVDQLSQDIEVVKAGVNADGFIWMVSKIFSPIKVLGDEIQPYLLIENRINGKKNDTVRVCLSLLRMVCNNQFNAAFNGAKGIIHIDPDDRDVSGQVQQAQNVILETRAYMEAYAMHAEHLASVPVADTYVEQIIRDIAKVKLGKRPSERQEENMEAFMHAYQAQDNQNLVGTAWGVMNAYTDYATHLPPSTRALDGAQDHFEAVSFNNRDQTRMLSIVSREHTCPICGTDRTHGHATVPNNPSEESE